MLRDLLFKLLCCCFKVNQSTGIWLRKKKKLGWGLGEVNDVYVEKWECGDRYHGPKILFVNSNSKISKSKAQNVNRSKVSKIEELNKKLIQPGLFIYIREDQ